MNRLLLLSSVKTSLISSGFYSTKANVKLLPFAVAKKSKTKRAKTSTPEGKFQPIKIIPSKFIDDSLKKIEKPVDRILPQKIEIKQKIEDLESKKKLTKSTIKDVASSNIDLNEFSKITQPIEKYLENKIDFSFDNKKVKVYTDGACFNNGKRNAKGGIGVYWDLFHPLNISKQLHGLQTNNRAEITAASVALLQAIKYNALELTIYTDSNYTIECMTKYIKEWKKNGWKLTDGSPVKNQEDLQILDYLCSNIKMKWIHVYGHRNCEGNIRADHLSRIGIFKKE